MTVRMPVPEADILKRREDIVRAFRTMLPDDCVIDGANAMRPFETDARFGFHHVNAHEDGDDVIVDICTFEDAGITS